MRIFIIAQDKMNTNAQCIATAAGGLPPHQDNPAKTIPQTASSGGVIRKVLPLAAFSMAFAIVMTILILYMDNTAMRHHQFRVNMSQDYELLGVAQDNPQLITYIREVHLRPAIEPNHHKTIEFDKTAPSEDVAYVLKLLNDKTGGVFVEAGAYNDGKTSRTEWLEKKLNWQGLLIQADTRHFFSLRRHNRRNSQAVHACLSSMPYPKEVTFHQQETEVKINSIHANSLIDDPDWTRIKCFPLFSLLLAMNATQVDYFSLEASGNELQVLETIPFERVRILVVSVHLQTTDMEKDTIKQFLAKKKYLFMQQFNSTFVFMLNPIKI